MRVWWLLLLLVGCAAPGAGRADGVTIQTADVALFAPYPVPPGRLVAPAVVALHGCGGPFPARDGQWRDLLVAAGIRCCCRTASARAGWDRSART